MPVLKATQTSPLIKDAIVLDLGDVSRQAERLRQAAREKARQILDTAQQQARTIAKQTYDEALAKGHESGFAQGMEEGREEGKATARSEAADDLKQVEATWLQAARQWQADRQQLFQCSQEQVVDFALLLAQKLLHRVIEMDRSVIVDQVANALGYVLRPLDVKVCIHPEDRPSLEDALPQLMAEFSHLEQIELIDDDAISRGGCVVKYGQGRIDATVETQLRRVVELMLPDRAVVVDKAQEPKPQAESQPQ